MFQLFVCCRLMNFLDTGLSKALVKAWQRFNQVIMLSLATRRNAENASFANQGRQTFVEKFVQPLVLESWWMIVKPDSQLKENPSTISWEPQHSASTQLCMMLALLRSTQQPLWRKFASLAAVFLLVSISCFFPSFLSTTLSSRKILLLRLKFLFASQH